MYCTYCKKLTFKSRAFLDCDVTTINRVDLVHGLVSRLARDSLCIGTVPEGELQLQSEFLL